MTVAVHVDALRGPAAAAAESAFMLVYADAFAEAPYLKTTADVEANARRFRSQTRKTSFRAAIARTDGGEPVGIAYGYALSSSTGWWNRLTTPVTADLRHEDGHRTFGLIELAVRAPWRRLGIARILHDTVLDGSTEERVLLNARPDVPAAQATYRSLGYRKVGEAYPWDGAALHDVMLLDLLVPNAKKRHRPSCAPTAPVEETRDNA